MRAILVLALLAVALAGDNLTITTNCTRCTNSTMDCFYIDGGPFQAYEIPVNETNYSSCLSPKGISFPEIATFSCGSDRNCTNSSCFLHLSTYSNSGWCTTYSIASSSVATLNIFYSFMKGDPTLDSTYGWCDNLCGPGLPIWVIIVIAVAAVLVIIAIAVGIWWWRKKHGGKLPDFDADTGQNLLK